MRPAPWLVAALAGAVPAFATQPVYAAWTLPEGGRQLIVRFEEYVTDEFFDLDGNTIPLTADGEYRKSTLGAYLEYGLRDSWMLFANVPFEYARYQDDSGFESSGTSFGDGEFGVRNRLSAGDARYTVAWQASVKVPLYSEGQDPQPGNHQVDLDLRLPLGYGFGDADQGGYITLLPGVRFREGDPTDEARVDLSFGWRPSARWLLELSGFWLRSLERGEGTTAPTTNPGNGIDFDRTRVQFQAVFWARPTVGIMAGAYRDVDGRNVGRGDAAYAGLWLRY
jgi:hypothetical protein